jgi:hypothetical protein
MNNGQLILEGGASGHMNHPFDDNRLTFGDLKELIDRCLKGELNIEEDVTEKTDGQNIWATIQDGEVKFARNKTEAKNPVPHEDFRAKFESHPEKVKEAFQLAVDDLADNLLEIEPELQQSIFNDGLNFVNIEIIYSQNPNVIHYGRDLIQFHDIKKTDGEGHVIDTESDPAQELVAALEDVEATLGETFSIIPPRIVQMQQDINFSANKEKFTNKVERLKNQYGLSDSDQVMKYHENWWREEIENEFPDIPEDIKQGLVDRWAYGDKKSVNFRNLDKYVEEDEVEDIKNYDKQDAKKRFKENIKPFEELFLELGSIVLKNISNLVVANPEEEMQRLQQQIRDTADSIKASGDLDQIAKVEAELERLQQIGGIESIIPTEGIVFRYKGNQYKLTGNYAAINQLMGVMKYGR